MLKELKPALLMLLVLTLLTGVAYPLLVTGVAQAVFPYQANGSLIEQDGKVLGSALIGQPFSDPKYFWGRPSATGPLPPHKGDAGFVSAEALTNPLPYNAGASSGSNLGPTNPTLEAAVKARMDALKATDPGNPLSIPVDLVTASGSGLDPHISPAAAEYQIGRVAHLRGMSLDTVRALVAKHTEGRQFGGLGEVRVHVLQLNLALAGQARP